jgi:hypothetical protein
MKIIDWRYYVLLVISIITILSGVVQMAVPGVILAFMSAQIDPTTMHFFGIVGMFMTLFGGLWLHALTRPDAQPVASLWASLQKVGAFAAVSLGVLHQVFAPVALAVATFDLLTGLIGLSYWWSTVRTAPP